MKKVSSYNQILKATSIFGGVQIFNIIINIFRGKIVAVLLGPTGIGFMGLINSTLSLVGALTNFGLATSAVKNISISSASNDVIKIQKTIKVIKRLCWYTGTLGVLVTLIFSNFLSYITFGNNDYTFSFAITSTTLLFNQLTTSNLVILQGLRKLNKLAKASLWGSLISLIITIPIYYIWGYEGITTSILIGSIIPFFVIYKINNIKELTNISLTKEEFRFESKDMLRTGILLSISSLIGILISYIIRLFIGRIGDLGQVGLYSAGFAIINTYVNLVFSAMGTDYYPRLTATITDNVKTSCLINEQAELALIILSPILVVFIILIKPLVILMYSSSFTPITTMLIFSALSIYLKTTFWPVGFLFLSKGKNKIFFYSELFSNIYTLLLSIIGYYYWGLVGIGVSNILSYLINMIQVLLIGKYFFYFSFEKKVYILLILKLILGTTSIIIVLYTSNYLQIILGIIIILTTTFYSLYEMNKRVDLKELVVNKLGALIRK
ncbi:MAG: oligosaccharide flippase family protein [Bacteroidia bacterium]